MNYRKIQYQILITLIFGVLAYLTRALNLITPLGGIFVLDLRDFFVAIGAAIGGPGAGFLIGVMAGLPAKIPVIDITSFAVAGLSVGYFSTYFYKRGINVAFSAIFMLAGYAVAQGFLFFFQMTEYSIFLLTRALICTPINIFIIYNLFAAYPRMQAAARYPEETTE
jgi:hypothetical protein